MAEAASPNRAQWLYGPAPDLLFGGCLIYLPLFALLLFAGPWMQSVVPPGLLPLVILVFGTPHVGATLLRAYESEEDRRTYRIFVLHLTVLLAALFAVGLYVPLLGSALLTVYLTVVPWHFMAQNYGVQLVFLRRRGVDVTPRLKRQIWLSFVLPYAMTLLALHGGTLGENYAPFSAEGTPYGFLSLGIPYEVLRIAIPALLLGYVYTLTSSVLLLRDQLPWRDLGPAGALFLTQALWYVVPIVLPAMVSSEHVAPFSPENRTYTFIWINQVHAVQYLWISSYYERRRHPGVRLPGYLAKAMLVGSVVYGVPLLLLGPLVIGGLPYNSGLYLMLAGALNLHHVMLDSAIWKLRDGRLARVLLRPRESAVDEGARGGSGWGRLALASGAVGVAITVFGTLEYHGGFERALASRDLERLETSAQRLRWMGRDDPTVLAAIGALRLERGDVEGALEAAEASNDLHPNVRAWHVIGAARARSSDPEGALSAYRRALDLGPDDVPVLLYASRTALARGYDTEGLAWLERAATLKPDHPEVSRTLRQARAREGRVAAEPIARP